MILKLLRSLASRIKRTFSCTKPQPKGIEYKPLLHNEVRVEPRKSDADYLYVILPYFNYCAYESRKRLFLEFVKRIQNNPKVRIVIAEARENNGSFDLPCENLKIFLHIRVVTHHRIWIKENLINLAVKQLPPLWTYMAWVDADLTFMNRDWVDDTMEALRTHDVAQMFQSCINLGPTNEAMKLDQSFFHMYLRSGKPYHKNAKYGFWHPGYAWACTKKAYTQMGGLVEFAILGSGDRHMALALIGKVDYSHPGNIHPNYAKRLMEFQSRCAGLRSTFVPGTILHHFHGSIADRRYQERWNILTKNQYNPDEDIVCTQHGVVQLTKQGERIHEALSNYFVGRKEDNDKI